MAWWKWWVRGTIKKHTVPNCGEDGDPGQVGSSRSRRPLSSGDGDIEKEREPHQCRCGSELGRHEG